MIELFVNTTKRLRIPPDFDGTKILFDMYSKDKKPIVTDTSDIQIESCNYSDSQLINYLRHLIDLRDDGNI